MNFNKSHPQGQLYLFTVTLVSVTVDTVATGDEAEHVCARVQRCMIHCLLYKNIEHGLILRNSFTTNHLTVLVKMVDHVWGPSYSTYSEESSLSTCQLTVYILDTVNIVK